MKEELIEKLERADKNIEEVIESRNTLMKEVESVGNDIKEKQPKKHKINIQCRDFNKPNGCSWGDKCKFAHGEGTTL